MIILSSTSDLLRVITDASTCSIDAVATSYDLDQTTNTSTPAHVDKATITTNTTTTLVSSPGASTTQRAVTSLCVRNRHATANCRVTVVHSDGTNVPELFGAILYPGDELAYETGRGWYVCEAGTGSERTQTDDTMSAQQGIGVWSARTLLTDVSETISTANQYRMIRDLAVPVQGNASAISIYYFRFVIQADASNSGQGFGFAVASILTTGSVLISRSAYTSGANAKTSNEGITAYDIPASATATSPTNHLVNAEIEGFVTLPIGTQASLLSLRWEGSTATGVFTIKAGSLVQYVRVL